jgi:hypothetical protein
MGLNIALYLGTSSIFPVISFRPSCR